MLLRKRSLLKQRIDINQSVWRYVASVLADTHKVSAKIMQRILRHKNLSSTEKYIHNINHDLHAVVNLLSTNGPHMAPIDKKVIRRSL